jgi:hypothetical protein
MASALMKASAWMVSVGLKTAHRREGRAANDEQVGISQVWPYLFTTDVLGSLPMRVPPS